MNLYEETRRDLELHGYRFADIHHIECNGENIPVQEFTTVAKQINYEPSIENGIQTIAPTLLICGEGWELARYVSSGTEYWNIRPTIRERPAKNCDDVKAAILNRK